MINLNDSNLNNLNNNKLIGGAGSNAKLQKDYPSSVTQTATYLFDEKVSI